MYIYTTSRTSDRRAQRGLPPRQLLGNFSTALAGGRGAASASDALRWQAPRGGSSAPPFWWGLSSACPTQARAAQRRLLCTAVASRGVSWFGRALAACEGGIQSHVRARGVGRSSGRASKVCRLGGARRKPAVIIPSIPLFASEARGRAPKAVALQRGTIERTVEESAYVPRRRRCAFWPLQYAPSRAVVKAGTLSSKPDQCVPARVNH